ncbi:hypothetical protein ACWGJX_38920 [Streptomyces sp. NPDC054775]
MVAARSAMVGGIAYAVIAIVLASRFGTGRNVLRIATLVYGAWHCVVGVFSLGFTASNAPAATIVAVLVELAAGVLLILFMVHKDGITWFNRPRH